MQLAVERIVTGMRVQADNHGKFARRRCQGC